MGVLRIHTENFRKKKQVVKKSYLILSGPNEFIFKILITFIVFIF